MSTLARRIRGAAVASAGIAALALPPSAVTASAASDPSVTVNDAAALLPARSRAVHDTVVMPIAKTLPDTCEQVRDGCGSWSATMAAAEPTAPDTGSPAWRPDWLPSTAASRSRARPADRL